MTTENKDLQLPNEETPDEDTKKILDDMKAEGELPEDKPEGDKPEEEPEQEETPEEEPKEDAPEETPEEEQKLPPHMPLSKYNKVKEKWESERSEFEKKIDDLTQKLEQASAKSTEGDIEAFAAKHGMDKNVVMDLVGVIKKQANISPDLANRIDKVEKDYEVEKERLAYENNFNEQIVPVLKDINSEATNEQLKKAKDKLKELAYSDRYGKYELSDIVSLNKAEFDKILEKKEPKKTAESGRPGSQKGKQITGEYKDMDTDELVRLSTEEGIDPKEFEKISNELEKRSPSILKVTDDSGNIVN